MQPKVICLTPVKNEAWILERFLKLASLWADHIIIADQMSTDGSREIARSFEKVILIDNTSEAFNEPERQKLLIDEARKIPGPRLLITLDADEFLTPNFHTSPEWETMLNVKAGTIIKFLWVHFQPDFKTMRKDEHYPWGYMDDGAEHVGQKIHSVRIPYPENNPILILNEINVIHFAWVDPGRVKSKNRWYQCYERINFPKNNVISIIRMYNQHLAFPETSYIPIPLNWFSEFKKLNIDVTSIKSEPFFWWDFQVLELLSIYGEKAFKKISIWDLDWNKVAHTANKQFRFYSDPRNKLQKKIQTYILLSQHIKGKSIIRLIDKLLSLAGY